MKYNPTTQAENCHLFILNTRIPNTEQNSLDKYFLRGMTKETSIEVLALNSIPLISTSLPILKKGGHAKPVVTLSAKHQKTLIIPISGLLGYSISNVLSVWIKINISL